MIPTLSRNKWCPVDYLQIIDINNISKQDPFKKRNFERMDCFPLGNVVSLLFVLLIEEWRKRRK